MGSSYRLCHSPCGSTFLSADVHLPLTLSNAVTWLHFYVDWQNSFSAISHQAAEACTVSPEINTWQMTNLDTCLLSVLLPAILHNNHCMLRLLISDYKNISWLYIVLSAVWNRLHFIYSDSGELLTPKHCKTNFYMFCIHKIVFIAFCLPELCTVFMNDWYTA